ncbi:hypothetical protein GCA01S_029_00410 [Parageobacillus caldoxylosilyticus NBRC 107762]|uniref:Transposase n=1 Tax=Parageobacillus caldoxylosilyticus NBRC 107762 TaxID=1220594 RepID=A0A023DF40_9BACL|nr:hypothetical protein PcaKH35_01640 [Parageobacillus caldoxylosilyticus]GAJ39862.1 hypothetical protein GCA01S_029_00410 [Parageobacillus caldoxylosilyticus NBRC 107762]
MIINMRMVKGLSLTRMVKNYFLQKLQHNRDAGENNNTIYHKSDELKAASFVS